METCLELGKLRPPAGPLKYYSLSVHSREQIKRVSFFEMLEWVKSWPWAHREGKLGLYRHRQWCPSILGRRLKEYSIEVPDVHLQGLGKASI